MKPDTEPALLPDSKPKRQLPRAGLIGPLFGWELVRLARRGQDARARFLLASGLLVVLTFFTLIWFRDTDPIELFLGTSSVLNTRESARFGERFTIAFLLAQLAVLVLLTPAYAAGAISEEKERKTFDYLLISELSNREIVFGKLLGRLTFLLGVLLAGLPILALTQVYGGTSEKFLLMGYLITATTVVMLAAMSAACAIAVESYRGALFRAYGFTALVCLLGGGVYPIFSPFVFIPMLWSIEADGAIFWILGLLYAGVELTIALGSLLMGIYWVRKMRAQPIRKSAKMALKKKRRPEAVPVPVAQPVEELIVMDDQVSPVAELGVKHKAQASEPLPEAKLIAVPSELPTAQELPATKKYRRPKVPKPRREPEPDENDFGRPRVWDNDPILWKETYITGYKITGDDLQIRGLMIAIGVSIAVLLAMMAVSSVLVMLASGFSTKGIEVARRMLLTAGVSGYFCYLLVVGSAAAGAIVRERQRLTLESLLTLPLSQMELLWPKWRVAIQKGWWFGVPTMLLIPMGMQLGNQPLLLFPVLLAVVGGVPLITSYSLWLSVRCKTMTRALLWSLPLMGTVAITPVLVNWVCSQSPGYNLLIQTLFAILIGFGAAFFWWRTRCDFRPETLLS